MRKESKYNYDDFKKYLNELKYNIIEGTYKNCISEFIICDKDGYKAMVKPNRIIDGRSVRFFHPNNKYAIHNIKKFISNNNYNIELLSKEYSLSSEKLEFICLKHNSVFYRTVKNIRNGKCCPFCNKVKPYTKDMVLKVLDELKLQWVKGENLGCNSKITVKDKHGYKADIILYSLMNNKKHPAMFHVKNPYTIDNIKLFLTDNIMNIELLSTNYINSHKPLVLKCIKHNYQFNSSWEQLQSKRFKGCPKCSGSYTYTFDKIVELSKNINPDIEILYETYKNNKRGFICKCNIDGHTWFNSFSNIVTNPTGCRICQYRSISGENNYNYNHEKTTEERILKREYPEYYKWRNDVYKRDNYTCQCCGYNKGGKLNAHHLFSYSKYKNLRTLKENGITLCKNCHDEFHNEFGYIGNTLNQFKEYYKNKLNVEFFRDITVNKEDLEVAS